MNLLDLTALSTASAAGRKASMQTDRDGRSNKDTDGFSLAAAQEGEREGDAQTNTAASAGNDLSATGRIAGQGATGRAEISSDVFPQFTAEVLVTDGIEGEVSGGGTSIDAGVTDAPESSEHRLGSALDARSAGPAGPTVTASAIVAAVADQAARSAAESKPFSADRSGVTIASGQTVEQNNNASRPTAPINSIGLVEPLVATETKVGATMPAAVPTASAALVARGAVTITSQTAETSDAVGRTTVADSSDALKGIASAQTSPGKAAQSPPPISNLQTGAAAGQEKVVPTTPSQAAPAGGEPAQSISPNQIVAATAVIDQRSRDLSDAVRRVERASLRQSVAEGKLAAMPTDTEVPMPEKLATAKPVSANLSDLAATTPATRPHGAGAYGSLAASQLGEAPVSSAVSSAPSSVQTSPGTPPQTAPADRAVVQQITAAIVPGTAPGRIELVLDPPELGRLEVLIELADQSLKATITADRQGTNDLIRRHLDLLDQQFRQAGFDDVDLSFSDDQSGRGDDLMFDDGQRSTETDAESHRTSPRHMAQPQLGPGRVDIRL